MRQQIKYISETGRSFDTPEEAIQEDKRLPKIIATYKADLAKMEGGAETFGSVPVTAEMIQQWKDAIKGYEEKWEAAQLSWENA